MPASRAYDHAWRVYLSASVYHHGLTDTVRITKARANSRVLRLASALMGEIVARQREWADLDACCDGVQ